MAAELPAKRDDLLKRQIQTELRDLKKMTAAFGPARLKDGTWFNEFVRAMLQSYTEKIIKAGGVNYFRQKDPGLTQDAIAEKLGTLAMRYAAVAGGVTGLTASTSVLGGLTIPMVIAAIGGEILFTTRLQIRLVYDLSMVYGDPIDLDDPEQLYRAFALAYGVSAASANVGAATAAVGSEVVRAQAVRFITGRTPIIQEAAIKVLGSKIGAMITRRAIVKTIVPMAGVAIASSWNYLSTKGIAEIARQEFRLEAQARQAAYDICDQSELKPDDLPVIVQAVQAIINIDGTLDPRELEVYRAIVSRLNIPTEALQEVESRVEINADAVEKQLRSAKRVKLRRALAEFMKLAVAADGEIGPKETELLKRFLPALKEKFDAGEIQARAAQFKRRDVKGLKEQAGALGKRIGGWLARKPQPSQKSETPAAAPKDEAALLERLTLLHAEGLLTDEELGAKKQEVAARFAAPTITVNTETPTDVTALELIRLHALINLMKADGTVDAAESDFVNELIAVANLNDDQRRDLETRLTAKTLMAVDFASLRDRPKEALSLIMDLVTLAQRDNKLHPAEKIYIKKTAEQLSLPREEIEELLAV